MAVCGDGELYTWGCGKNGRLGLGRFDSCPLPTRVLAQGDSHCLFVACGEAHSGMIDQEGKVWLWGAGSYGRLGHGEEEDVQVPKQVEAFDEMTETPGQIRILSIALGGFHSLFLEEPAALSGRIFSCGSGPAVGSLSEGDNMSVLVPRVLSDSVFGTKGGIKQMAAGMYHNYVLQENGDLIRWGVGSNGRLGIGEDKVKTMSNPETHKNLKGFAITMHPKAFTHPTEKPVRKVVKKDPEEQEGNANTVKQVTCGAMHTAALIKGGQLYVWGSNSSGQLGLGPDPAFSNVWVPRRCVVGNERKVKEIAAGFEHLLCVTTNAECYSWGKGTSGQLGTGRARDSFEPMLVSGLTQVVKVAAGEEHSAAICLDARGSGELFTWGSAENGMLGLGDDFTSGPQTSPTTV
jgi:alpha-tubulin suppressor-like RCC1 family protein